jgi:hypothetical protein
MAKNQNTYAKRARELEKKQKAEEKRGKRRNKKDQPSEPVPIQDAEVYETTQTDSEQP